VRNQAGRKRITVAKKFGRVHVFGIIAALAVLVVGAVTVLSRQTAGVTESKSLAKTSLPAAKPNENYATVKVAG